MSTIIGGPSEGNDPGGVKGFRRIFDWLRSVFSGGGGSQIIITPLAGVQGQALQQMAQKLARARIDDPVIKSRVAATKDKLAIFDGEIAPQLDLKLRLAFHPENFARMYWVRHTSSNVMLRVINDVSILYQNPAKRTLKEKEKQVTQTEGSATDKPGQKKALPPGKASPLKEQQKAADPTKGKTPSAPVPGDKEKPEPTNPDGPQTGDPDIDALADVLELSGAKDETEQTPFDKLQKAYDLDVLLDTVEKLCMVCPVVWVRPIVTYEKTKPTDEKPEVENDASTAKLTFQIYTPDCADVVLDPTMPSEAMAFYYFGEEFNSKLGKMVRVIHFWSRHDYIKFDTEWKLISTEPHGMDRLPITPFRIQFPRNGYFVDNIGDDLKEATLELNLLKTLQNSRTKDSAFKQVFITGDSAGVDQDAVMGGPIPIMLGEENTAGVLDLQPNLEAFTDMWKEREVSLAATYGINAATYKAEGHPESGFAKKLDQDKVLRESTRRRKFFTKAEQDLYQNIAKTLEEYPMPAIGKLDPVAELEVDFSEPTFEEDPQTQARTDAIELKYNAVSIIDIMRRKEPDLNDVELVEMAYKNKRINDAFMTTDQMKLTDLLATRANVGGSFGQVGGGDSPPPGEDGPPSGGPPKGPPKAGGFPPKGK